MPRRQRLSGAGRKRRAIDVGIVDHRAAGAVIDDIQPVVIRAGDAAPDSQFAAAKSEKFFDALDDDLNISAALAEVFDQIRETNSSIDCNELTAGQAAALLLWWQRINQVLQLQEDAEAPPENVTVLLKKRAAARADKNWSQSDTLRAEIESLGWLVKDTKDGQKLTKKSGLT